MFKRFLLALLLGCLNLGVQASAVYNETGDAGDFASPQDVVGMSITRIHGDIGGANDPVDAFRFHFGGGSLAILAQLDDGQISLPIRLIRENGTVDDPCFAGDVNWPPNPCDATDWLDFSADGLAAGNYILGVCAVGTQCLADDPPFTIYFMTGPTTGEMASISAPVPNPGALALIAIGLIAMWLASRRSARRDSPPTRPS
jgi:hypothetical protein